jgi:hypothetical protein
MPRIFLVIKGSLENAIAQAIQRKIELENLECRDGAVYGYTNQEEERKLTAWFAEDAEYELKPGSLLWYTAEKVGASNV